MVRKHYKDNRMVLWSHGHRDPDDIIAKNVSLKMEDEKWWAITEFAMEEIRASQIYRLYKGGFLNAWSVGFIPIAGTKPKPEDGGVAEGTWKADEGQIRYIHDKWELLEYSAVAIPSNREAMTAQVAKEFQIDDELLKQLVISFEEIIEGLPGNTVIFDLKEETNEEKKEGKGAAEKKDGTEGKEEGFEEISPGEEFILWADYLCEDGLTKGCLTCESMPDDLKQIIETDEIQTPDEIKEIAQWLCDRAYEDGEKIEDEVVTKPLPNTHSCRVKDPKKFTPGSFRTIQRDLDGKPFSIIIGRLKGKTKTTTQGYRYPKKNWTAAQAKAHCESHDGIKFEAAKDTDLIVTRELFEDMSENIKKLREDLEAKTGRTLSAQTRAHITDCVGAISDASTAMKAAAKKLSQLLTLTDKPPDPEEERIVIVDEEKEEKEKILLTIDKEPVTKEEDDKDEPVKISLQKPNPATKDQIIGAIKTVLAELDLGGELQAIIDKKKGKIV